MDLRVKAIRENTLIGRGTCSIVSECMTDEEIITELDQWKILDPRKAVEFYITSEDINVELNLNTRAGSDDDPELKAWNNWLVRKSEYDKNVAPSESVAARIGAQ